ncbi:E3 ubiquitin-protein ligase [Capsicum chinense]|nr:E3 ubiquitin-protein ligase [Capsicum chinense]
MTRLKRRFVLLVNYVTEKICISTGQKACICLWIIGSADSSLLLTHDAPELYWFYLTFLAFDVFFVVICVAVACPIEIAVCCCLPCIIAILYAVKNQWDQLWTFVLHVPQVVRLTEVDEDLSAFIFFGGISLITSILVWLHVIWILAYVVAVVESKRGFEALKRSANLVNRKIWKALALVLFYWIWIHRNCWVDVI